MLKSVNSKAFSTVCVILSGILWGIIAIFVDGLKRVGFSSVQCAAIRCIFTSLLLLIIILITDAKSLKVELKDLFVFLCSGAFGISVFSLCYFKAIHILGGASVPSLLLNTSPIFVLIIASIFFKEKITLNKIVAIVMAVFGVACVSGVFNGVGAISLEGLIFGILSGLGYALYSVFTKSVAKKYNPLVINFYAYLFAMLVVVPASGIFNDIGLLITPKGALYSLGLVVLCTAVPSVLYSFGMKNLNVSTVSVMAMIDPVTATVIGLAIMSESISVFKIVGIICVLTAIVILNLPQKEKNK
ncbi:MAG: EamA family transporter [Clostridia bacterium]|nr:EamA family transporter [Clostridia bacterium]